MVAAAHHLPNQYVAQGLHLTRFQLVTGAALVLLLVADLTLAAPAEYVQLVVLGQDRGVGAAA